MMGTSELTIQPRVSVIIPAHNEELVIRRTVESMLALDYPEERIEIIVINDGSSDSTAQIVEEFDWDN